MTRKPCTSDGQRLAAESSMASGEQPTDQQLIERLHRAAHACEGTGELWGRAWARWLRTLIVLASRHDPNLREIHRMVHLAVEREDWHAVLAICNEHNPSPWRKRT
jgi:hypothetical protein